MRGHCIIQKESALRNISENLAVFWNWSSKAVRKACGSMSTASTSYMHKHYQATFELLLCTSLVWNFTFSIIENMNCVFFCAHFCVYRSWKFHERRRGGGILTLSWLSLKELITTYKDLKSESACTYLSCLFRKWPTFITHLYPSHLFSNMSLSLKAEMVQRGVRKKESEIN